MMKLRAQQGGANRLWLDARHSFSFGHYYDPEWMGHSALRVISQDLVAPGGGFADPSSRQHGDPHLRAEGTIEHRDSLGHAEQIRRGFPADERRVRHPHMSTTPRRPSRSPVADLDRAE